VVALKTPFKSGAVAGLTRVNFESRSTTTAIDVSSRSQTPISTSSKLGYDVSHYDLDGPLPEIPESNASRSGRQRLVDRARRENLTVRQLAQIAGSYGGLAMIGTPAMIADEMEQWLVSEGCDGFNVMFPYVPGGLDDFVDRVVPELQRRGIFRREYEGKTLRENLGLPRPANRFFSNSRSNLRR
jgi:hypothetical protein